MLNIATSSIKKNFLVSGEKQAELFADAIESSYMESLCRKTENENSPSARSRRHQKVYGEEKRGKCLTRLQC